LFDYGCDVYGVNKALRPIHIYLGHKVHNKITELVSLWGNTCAPNHVDIIN